MIVIGLMSGTSADGIDVAVVEINGAPPRLDWKLISHTHAPHDPAIREQIFRAFRPETSDVASLCQLNFSLGKAFASAALLAIHDAGLEPAQVDLIGSHGQTLWHIPTGPGASTLQLGEAAVIAEMMGIDTINNFRTRDMAAGGQGAPLVAYVDQLMFSHPTLTRAVQNIGGIANVTFLPSGIAATAGMTVFAFDTGPGNMLIDDGARRVSMGTLSYDPDGSLAAKGYVCLELLGKWLEMPYFGQKPPKTTGRELFGVQLGETLWQDALAFGLSEADTLATITALTSESIARAYHQFLPSFPDQVIISGGGVHNLTLMSFIEKALSPAAVITVDSLGLMSDAKEAVAFAVLAYETKNNRPGNLPGATGASHPVILGSLTPGSRNH